MLDGRVILWLVREEEQTPYANRALTLGRAWWAAYDA